MSGEMHNLEPDDLNNYAQKSICAQCVHFYAPITFEQNCEESSDGCNKHGNDEKRLCYEIYWCNASSPVCDEFKPLINKELLDHLEDTFPKFIPNITNDEYFKMLEKEVLKNSSLSGTYSFLGNPQKEIQYVYIGLLQENPNAIHKQDQFVEVPTEIDGVATNYRRVEMMPLDWYIEDGEILMNSVDIEFSEPQTNWGLVEYFGIYDSLIDGSLIEFNKLNEGCIRVKIRSLVVFRIGKLSIPLNMLKGGE